MSTKKSSKESNSNELYTVLGTDSKILMPLQMEWQPKEDITTYELALCMQYLVRHAALCVLGFSISQAFAGDMSECSKIQDKDKRNYCMASYAASGTYCEMIKSYEMRRDCMSKVVQKQRELSYKIVKKTKPPEEEPK